MKTITRSTLIISFFIFNSFSLLAQGVKIGLPEIEYYSRSQYGGDRQNWKITQDQYDLLYFANNDGLLSFDGINWKLHSQKKSFSCARSVKSIEGRIYVGSYNELGYFEYNKAQNLVYKSLVQNEKLRKSGDFWDIVAYDKKVVFYSEKAIVFYKEDKLDTIIQASCRFLGLFSVNGHLLVQDIAKGLMEYHNNALSVIPGGEIFLNTDIGSITPIGEQQFVIGTLKDGLFLWDSKGIHPWEVAANALLKKANILCGVCYQKDLLAFGTIQMGLVITNKRGEVVSQIGKDKGLQNNTVLSICVDKEDNIWCGLDNGIAKINYDSSISFLQSYYDLGTGFAMEHFNGYYYLATIQALYRISEEKFNSQLKDRNDFVKIPGTEGQCWSLYKDDETILCGHTFGAFSIQGNTAKLITPPTVNGLWVFRPVPNNPNLLIAGTYDGLILLEKTNKQWHFKTKIEGFAESSRYVEWESDHTLFVSHTTNGVYKLDFNSDYTKIIKTNLYAFSDFPDNSLPLSLSIIEDKCVFSNLLGIYSFNEKRHVPEHLPRYENQFSEKQFPAALKEDKFENVWYFYSNHLGVLRKLEDGSIKNIYFPFEPLKRKLVNYFESCYVQDNSNTFFNTEDGFAHYLANETKNYQIPFQLHVVSFQSLTDSNSYCYFKNGKENLPQSIIPQYSFSNNSFEVHYAATFYEDKNIQYSTFLNKIDATPTDWTSATSRSFSNLREGQYELTICAKNKYQVLTAPTLFRFVVQPPWYRTTFAKGIYSLCLLISIYLGIRLFRRYVKTVQQQATIDQGKQFSIKEERLLNEALIKEKEVIHMRHEKLSSEMNFKEKELASLTVHIVQKNDFLTDLKEQLRRVMNVKEPAETNRKINNIIKKIDKDIETENNWDVFERSFEQVHASFISHLIEKHPDLNGREQKLCAYIKLGMASKELASLMNISTRAVENNRYKLRQRLGLNPSDNLADYITNL